MEKKKDKVTLEEMLFSGKDIDDISILRGTLSCYHKGKSRFIKEVKSDLSEIAKINNAELLLLEPLIFVCDKFPWAWIIDFDDYNTFQEIKNPNKKSPNEEGFSLVCKLAIEIKDYLYSKGLYNIKAAFMKNDVVIRNEASLVGIGSLIMPVNYITENYIRRYHLEYDEIIRRSQAMTHLIIEVTKSPSILQDPNWKDNYYLKPLPISGTEKLLPKLVKFREKNPEVKSYFTRFEKEGFCKRGTIRKFFVKYTKGAEYAYLWDFFKPGEKPPVKPEEVFKKINSENLYRFKLIIPKYLYQSKPGR